MNFCDSNRQKNKITTVQLKNIESSQETIGKHGAVQERQQILVNYLGTLGNIPRNLNVHERSFFTSAFAEVLILRVISLDRSLTPVTQKLKQLGAKFFSEYSPIDSGDQKERFRPYLISKAVTLSRSFEIKKKKNFVILLQMS